MPSKNEVEVLRQQITEEVNRDAEVISGQLFPGNAQGREPDLSRVSEQSLKTIFRQKYLDQDRQWLQGEARRDPRQFVRVARAIGVVMPDELPDMQPGPQTLPQGPSTMSMPPPPPPVASLPVAGGAAAPVPADPALVSAALQQALSVPTVPPAGPAAGPPYPVPPQI